MRLTDIFEQGTVGSTPLPAAGGSSVQSTAPQQAGSASLSGNTDSLGNPALAAANLANQQAQKNTRKKQIQDQLRALDAQKAQLQTELNNLNKPA
jgi:hypothetical protein